MPLPDGTPHADGGRLRDQKGIAYEDKQKGVWLGFLFHDLSACDDGDYTIGCSSKNMLFTLYEQSWMAPLQGKTRAFMCILCEDKPADTLLTYYIKYYSHVSLNAVKDWVLDWEDAQSEYPKYYTVKPDTTTGTFSVDSDPVDFTRERRQFTVQPQGGTVNPEESITISWKNG